MFRKNPITIVLLLLILLFMLVFVMLYSKIETDNGYSRYRNSLEKMRLLEKDFRIFLLNPSGFKDYDLITEKQKEFESLLLKLDTLPMKKDYVSKIEEAYISAMEALEYQKSLHAMNTNNLNYLFELYVDISKSPLIHEDVKYTTEEIFFYITQYMIGYENAQLLQEDLAKLENYQDTKNLQKFYKQAQSLYANIQELGVPLQEYDNVGMSSFIQDAVKELEKRNQLKLHNEHVMNSIFALVIVVLFMVLLYLHRRSLLQQEDMKLSANVFEHIEEGLVVTDAKKNIIKINTALTNILGYTQQDCQGKTPTLFRSGEHSQAFYKRMWETVIEKGIWQGRINDRMKNGNIIPSWMSLSSIKDSYGDVTHYVSIHRNLSDIVQSQKRVDFLAYHDSLTQLPNRVNFEGALVEAIESTQRNDRKLAILFIDLDRFKIINDSLGHDVGDELLKAVTQRLRNSIRGIDGLARIGGDEFVVTIENLENSFDVSKVAQKVLKSLLNPFQLSGHLLNTTASIGIAEYPKDAQDAITLVKYADSAMYKAKERGKNRYCFFDEKIAHDMDEKLHIEQELRQALEAEELYLNFQPQYLLATRKVIALESLIRWNNHKLGMIGPDVFIPIAEESGLIVDIGYFVFVESCRFMQELRAKGIYLEQIAINVSSIQFQENNIIEKFLEIVAAHDLTPELIEIEITERYIMDLTSSNINMLDKLKEKGFKISIDDFGTGYSSLSYLKELPVNTLKIDKSFVDDLPDGKSDRAISKTILALCHSLDYCCVAEGIETKEQELFLLEEECDIGQGYYFSKPLSKEACEEFIISH